MKKTTLRSLCMMLAAMLLLSFPVSAADNDPADELSAQAVLSDGTEQPVDEIPDYSALADEDIDAYQLTMDGEVVFTVEETPQPELTGNIPTPVYSVEFILPETAKTVFLSGLTEDNAAAVQAQIEESYNDGVYFDITGFDFIDAEKTGTEDDDDELCWAAAAANILTASGWAQQAGFNSEDDLFELFVESFTPAGGNTLSGIAWFFNKMDILRAFGSTDTDGSLVRNFPNTGGYLTDYAYEQVAHTADVNSRFDDGMAEMLRKLREGSPVNMNISVVRPTSDYYINTNGHAQTLWGYVIDNDYPETAREHYNMIFLTDSDSDKRYAERRESPEKLQAYPLSTFTGTARQYVTTTSYKNAKFDSMCFELKNSGGSIGVINDYTAILPYSADIPKETDAAATRNKATDIDLVSGIFMTDSMYNYDNKYAFEAGTDIYYHPTVYNYSNIAFYGNAVTLYMHVENSEGDVILDQSYPYTPSANDAITVGTSVSFGILLQDLEIGHYTAALTLSTNVPEAYYYNNSSVYEFDVCDTYLIGDANGDGEISIYDVTKIQRLLAQLEEDPDGMISRRGSLTGGEVNIFDATMIQRKVAHYDDGKNIGEKALLI